MSGFLVLPTMVIPRECSALESVVRTIVGAGNIGSSGLTLAASLAACSMASISSLQLTWSRGQTTISCLSVMSLADVMCACVFKCYLSLGYLKKFIPTLTVR